MGALSRQRKACWGEKQHLMSMGAVLRRGQAEPGHSFGHRHLERVDAGSARALLLVHTLNVRAQQCFHVFNPCVAIYFC